MKEKSVPETAGEGERPRQIIARGGGGFLMNAENIAINRYILEQAAARYPAVAFVPTACGDDSAHIARFYATFCKLECKPSHLPLFGRTPDLAAYLLAQDVIYVGGGNTKSMLAVWREWGLPEILREAWDAGVVLAGVSAGAICWFEQGVTDSYEGALRNLDCLGFLPGSCCPHFSAEQERRPAYHQLLADGRINAGYAIDDAAALHFVGTELHQVIAARADASAWNMHAENGQVQEERLQAVCLNQPA